MKLFIYRPFKMDSVMCLSTWYRLTVVSFDCFLSITWMIYVIYYSLTMTHLDKWLISYLELHQIKFRLLHFPRAQLPLEIAIAICCWYCFISIVSFQSVKFEIFLAAAKKNAAIKSKVWLDERLTLSTAALWLFS